MDNNINNNSNNGRGVFYGVIGVATLIVTIIGATFAYFSATANSDVNAITAQSAQIGLLYSEDKSNLHTNLIPVDGASANFKSYPGKTGQNNCLDNVNNVICSVYTFTVTNPNQAAVTIYLSVLPTTNEFANMHFALYQGTVADITATANQFDTNSTRNTLVNPKVATTAGLVVADTPFGANATSEIQLAGASGVQLDATGGTRDSVTYTMVLWVQEANTDQTAVDANKNFAAQIKVNTSNPASGETGTGITGIITA